MSIGTLLLVILILMLVGLLPTWPHSRAWGYGSSGGLRASGHLADPDLTRQNLVVKGD